MFPLSLLSVVLSNLAVLASAAPGPLQYKVINNCPGTPIDVFFVNSMGVPSRVGPPIPRGEPGVTGSQPDNSGFFYTTVNQSTQAARAGFHADHDGDSYYYYVVKDVNNFKTGIRITPLDHPPDGGFCSVAQCEDVSCPFAFSGRPPTSAPNFPRPIVGVTPTPPLYSCPFAKTDVTYEITFCPSGDWPSQPPPVVITPAKSYRTKCLHVRDSNYANGTPVDIVDCDTREVSQQWFMNRGTTQIRTVGADGAFCLDAGSNPGSGVRMKIWRCYDNLPAQKWYQSSSNNGIDDHDRIALAGTGQCLDLTDGQLSNGRRMQTWECTPGNLNQVWDRTWVA